MCCPILNLFAKCHCSGGVLCLYCAQLTVIVMAIVFGALVAWKPRRTIDIQIAFYRLFNWRIEPISMEREIRNTRVMGLAVVIMALVSLALLIV